MVSQQVKRPKSSNVNETHVDMEIKADVNSAVKTSYPPTAEFLATSPRICSMKQYEEMHEESIHKPESFWAKEASDLTWFSPWEKVLSGTGRDTKWFTQGTTNISYNALDRHVLEGRGDNVALHFETEKGECQTYTYARLLDEVCQVANAIEKEFAVKSGDRVIIYLPICPENIISMLACARIGAIHSVVFGGFSAAQIRTRAEECQPKLIITSDGCFRRKAHLALKPIVDEAIEEMDDVKVLCVDRHTGAEFTMKEGRDFDWKKVVSVMPTTHEAVSLDSEAPLFILYTSGSTGRPKGVVHTTGGYMLGAYTTMKYVFDLKTTDTYWCTADMGWITGHTYAAYGPLLLGTKQLIYEGAFNAPDWSVLFKLIEKHNVSILYTAPTLLRAVMAQDVQPSEFKLDSLRLLGTVGEPTNHATWHWYFTEVGQRRCPIVDTWWQTETGANAITPIPGATTLSPGCATRPFFGIEPVIVDDDGKEVEAGVKGRLFIKNAWPSMLRGMWARSEEDLVRQYFDNPHGWYFTGDAAVQDAKGNITILGRCDDQLNVSGHRMGTAEIESAIQSHPDIEKVAVIPRPDEITGQAIAACVVLSAGHGFAKSGEMNYKQVNMSIGQHVKKEIGPHARPKYLYVVPGLPETKSGKTMRGLIRSVLEIIEIDAENEKNSPETNDALTKLEQKFSTLDKDNAPAENMVHLLSECMKKQMH